MSGLDVLAPAAWALLRHLGWEVWFSTVAFAVVGLAVVLLPRRWCRLRQLLWMLVLVRLLLPPDVGTPLSIWRLVGVRAAAPPTRSGGEAGLPEAFTEAGAARAVTPGLGAVGFPAALPVAVAALWLGGVALVGIVLSRRRHHFRRMAHQAEPVLDPRLLERMEHWRTVMGVRRRVRLLRSDEASAPFTVGSLAPHVVLPTAVVESGEASFLDCVLAHEAAHVGRWDDLALQVQAAVVALYFFHPAAWLAFRFSREEADRACDQMAVARGGIPARTYGTSLVASVSRGSCHLPLGAVPALAPTLRQVTARLEALAHCGRPVPGRVASIAAVAAFGVALQPAPGCTGRCAAVSVAVPAGVDTPSGAVSATSSSGPAPARQHAAVVFDPLPRAEITSGFFVMRRLPDGELDHHPGVDLGAAAGTPVRAAARGVVTLADESYRKDPRLGTVVVVQHENGVKTLYGHLESAAVRRGAAVEAGAVIGAVGTSGRSSGPHLHFEVRHRGIPVCPGTLADLLDGRGRGGDPRQVRCGSQVVPARPSA